MSNTLRYIIYCRKSTDSEDRQVQSLEAQERELVELANRNGLEIVKVYRESMSAKSPGRPVFNEIIGLLNAGKVDAILCWKLDRLARNFIDGGLIIDLLQRSKIKEIRTHEAIHLPSDNVLMLAVQLGMANQYIRDLSENVKRGNREKLSRGEWPGVAPFGYVNDLATRKVVVDSSKSHFVKRMFELYANEGKSYEEIADILYSEGLRTKTGKRVFKGTVQKIISSKFYIGLMERNGKTYQGIHEPIISVSLYETAQEVSVNKSRPRPSKHVFALSGFLNCASCGCVLTATKAKGHDYYYCTNGKKICNEHRSYMRESYLYEKVADVLGKLEFSPRMIELMCKAALERSNKDVEYVSSVLATLRNELNNLTSQESRLLDVFISGNISKEVYEEKLTDIRNRKVEIINEINRKNDSNPSVTFEQVKKVFEQGNTIRNEFMRADSEEKQRLLKNVLSNLSVKGKEIVITQYKSPYHLLANSPKKLTISQGLGYKDSNLD